MSSILQIREHNWPSYAGGPEFSPISFQGAQPFHQERWAGPDTMRFSSRNDGLEKEGGWVGGSRQPAVLRSVEAVASEDAPRL